VYFELNINEYHMSLTPDDSLLFRKASDADYKKIVRDIYPLLDGYGENDKKYLKHPNKYTVFIAEKENRIIHYFLVFENPINSPLTQTPIFKDIIGKDSAYLGSAFTSPHARGSWIMTFSVSHIINYLKEETNAKKALLLVHKDTLGASEFYKRLGFKIIKYAAPKGSLQWIASKIKL
jgi:ribosomal protein S18 acetylase RimI-like enzyme